MSTTAQNLPEFIINPVTLGEIAQNFRTYAEQVAFYTDLDESEWKYPYNVLAPARNPQYDELAGKTRCHTIAGKNFTDKLIELFYENALYALKTPEDIILFSLFAAHYIDDLATEQS